ncbi:MAG: hydrolase CocE/NonD family protein [Amycolatopsis sp.]|uniref:CocE/NonD family hydrolase n=1 Tax=Amycolatopsis sp. TaxID=37632 RepID=UPI00260E2632|nr:CocE/NonD family hydrolase [Amycolatopsis sp.]MCU1681942.1 hydrolase CocE/NonD family protein [Amycolatopsis sp.]
MSLSDQRGPFTVSRERDVSMVTRDGKRLLSDIYRPEGVESAPVLVRRTPYGSRNNDLADKFTEADFYASHGYLTVVQNTRGRFGSEGVWYPFVYEANDGYDAIEWAAQLPGSNGRVGTFGQSYGALVQYLAASQRPERLITCIPVSAPLAAFENYWYQRGALELSWTLSYFLNMALGALSGSGDAGRVARLEALKADPSVRFSPLKDEALRRVPLADWIDTFGDTAPFLSDVLHHSADGAYWWAVDMRRQFRNVDVPMLHLGSWYDIANWDTPQYFNGLREQAMSGRARENQAMIMGPWAHLLPYSQPTSRGTGDIDFGPEAATSLIAVQLAWFDHYLKDDGQDLPRAPVRIFVMGENRWRDEKQWPLERTSFTAFYLHSAGSANTADGDGTLTTEAPGPEDPDRYRYDPDNPVPTAGGRYVGGGVDNQAKNQARQDVLVYTAMPQDSPVEITGPVDACLHVSTDGTDTDFVAVLCDVHPDGFVQNLAEGIVRGRFRDSFDDPQPMRPNMVYELRVPLGNVSHVVAVGHRLRLHVTSSNFPRWDRNTNTGDPIDKATRIRVAEQTLLHDNQRPSRLILPVVPT